MSRGSRVAGLTHPLRVRRVAKVPGLWGNPRPRVQQPVVGRDQEWTQSLAQASGGTCCLPAPFRGGQAQGTSGRSWGLAGRLVHSTGAGEVGARSLAEGRQPADAVPEGRWFPLGRCQHQGLLLGQAAGRGHVLWARLVVRPAEGWVRRQ